MNDHSSVTADAAASSFPPTDGQGLRNDERGVSAGVEPSDAEVFERAIELVSDGWGQGSYYDCDCYCVMGALAAAAGTSNVTIDEERPDTVRTLCKVIGVPKNDYLGHANFGDVFAWNDAPERTQAEVVEALRRAAAIARGEVEPEGSPQSPDRLSGKAGTQLATQARGRPHSILKAPK